MITDSCLACPVAANTSPSLLRRHKVSSIGNLNEEEIDDEIEDHEIPDKLLPQSWVVWGVVASIIAG